MCKPCRHWDSLRLPVCCGNQAGWGAAKGLVLSAARAAKSIHGDSAGWSCWICPAAQDTVGLTSALGTHRAVLQLPAMSQNH